MQEIRCGNNMDFLFFIIISFILLVVGRFVMLFFAHLIEFLFFKVKTFNRFKNMVICTFWQTFCIFSKMDKYEWK